MDVNRRFKRLALDSLYIRDLDMTNIMGINSLYNQTSSIDTQVLSRICERIVPRIHHLVHKLTVEEYSMKHSSRCQLSSTLFVITYKLSRRDTLLIFNS